MLKIKLLFAVLITATIHRVALSQSKFGAEFGALYLNQSNGGNTFTALPTLNFKAWERKSFVLITQVGATTYKDERSENLFTIGILRLNPIYRFNESKVAIEGLFGTQFWEKSSEFYVDLGARVNYDISHLSLSFCDDIFLGGAIPPKN